MDDDDKQFESYLLEFQPRRPRPLPELALSSPNMVAIASASSSHRNRRIAAAAATVFIIGSSVWLASGKRSPHRATSEAHSHREVLPERRVAFTTLSLTQLALTDQRQLEKILTQVSRTSLCDVRSTLGALRNLAKD